MRSEAAGDGGGERVRGRGRRRDEDGVEAAGKGRRVGMETRREGGDGGEGERGAVDLRGLQKEGEACEEREEDGEGEKQALGARFVVPLATVVVTATRRRGRI